MELRINRVRINRSRPVANNIAFIKFLNNEEPPHDLKWESQTDQRIFQSISRTLYFVKDWISSGGSSCWVRDTKKHKISRATFSRHDLKTYFISSGSSGRVGGGKHEIYAATFSGHLFMTFYGARGGGGGPLGSLLDLLLFMGVKMGMALWPILLFYYWLQTSRWGQSSGGST